MTTRFHWCLNVVLGNEGGYVDHKKDRGGKTNYGITQKTLDDYCVRNGLPMKSVRDITQAEVEDIYFGYWRQCNAGKLFEPLDLLVFDCAINSGPGRAVKLLQKCLGVDADGGWGPKTAYALQEEISAGRETEICLAYLDQREDFYNKIVENDPSQKVFLKGWMNRLDHLQEYV